jgi:putative addiction module antidote
MVLKIVQIGNSLGITIPSEIRKKMNLKKGSKVAIEYTSDNQLIISKLKSKINTSSITPEFARIVEQVTNRYSSALKELSEK